QPHKDSRPVCRVAHHQHAGEKHKDWCGFHGQIADVAAVHGAGQEHGDGPGSGKPRLADTPRPPQDEDEGCDEDEQGDDQGRCASVSATTVARVRTHLQGGVLSGSGMPVLLRQPPPRYGKTPAKYGRDYKRLVRKELVRDIWNHRATASGTAEPCEGSGPPRVLTGTDNLSKRGEAVAHGSLDFPCCSHPGHHASFRHAGVSA